MGEQPMIRRLWFVAWALSLFSLLVVAGAQAQTAQAPTSPNPDVTPQAGSPSGAQATAQPAKPPAAPINTAEIVSVQDLAGDSVIGRKIEDDTK